jgi:ABC-type phosphate transport system substrate-binding protein
MHKQVKDPIKPSIIKKIYLGKVSRWNDNQRVRFYTFDSDDTTETFTKKYLSKSKRQFNKYWKRQVFTGKGNIPKSIKSVEEAIKIVSKTKGAIVYLPEQKIDNETIRIVSITN